MRIIFMGTPDFAVAALDALCASGQEVILAVTQPDRQRGRGRKVIQTPVSLCAQKWGVPVFQPSRIRDPEAVGTIRDLSPDLIVVAAFGQILPQELLDIPRLGCVNIHASLLPRLRGAAPIQWAVINGDRESGITLMQMDAGLDTGDILFQEKVEIDPRETGESLYGKLARLGGEMIVRHLPEIGTGSVTRIPQDPGLSTYAPMLRKEMGEIDWTMPAEQIERRMRGMMPWPGAFTRLNGHVLKIWNAEVLREECGCPAAGAGEAGAEADRSLQGKLPGTVVRTEKKRILVATGDGVLALLELQAEGKKRMGADAYLRGSRIPEGTMLG